MLDECTARYESGDFCSRPSLADSPFPVCFEHAAKLYLFMRDRVAGADPIDAVMSLVTDEWMTAQARAAAKRQTGVRPEIGRDAIVYYVRVGDLIKIGTTTNVYRRLSAFGPSVSLLATEPGHYDLEGQRHRQFANLRTSGEWFRAEEPLLDHIEKLISAAA